MMDSTVAATEMEGVDLAALGRALWRRKRWILLPAILTAALATIYVNVATPRYKSEARVLYEGRENVFLRPEADKTTTDQSTSDQEAIANQVQIVLSRDVALDVIKQLKLGNRPEFDPILGGISPAKYLLIFFGVARDPFLMTPEERVLQSYYDRLTAYAVEKSRVIVVEFQSRDPELAASIANAIADDYIVRRETAKLEQTRVAGQWLAGEIDKLRQRVADAEARVEDFRAKTNLFVGTNNTTLGNQQLGEVNSQLAAARAQKADADTRARLIREMLRRGDVVESSDIVNSELIRRLSEQRVTLRAQLAEQSSTLLDGHPRIKELKAQIADLDQQIRAEADKLARALENDAKIANARVETLSANLDALKRQAATSNGQDVQLRALEREAKAQRDLLESYLAKYREATARESIGNAPPADARVISRAIVSNTPYFPKKMPIILVATLAMLALCSSLVVTAEVLGTSAKPVSTLPEARLQSEEPSASDTPVAKLEGAPAGAAATPGLAEPERAALDVPQEPEPHATAAGAPDAGTPCNSEAAAAGVRPQAVPNISAAAIAAVAAKLQQSWPAGRRIAVVSGSQGAAASSAAVALARTLANDTRTVLLDLTPGAPQLRAIAAEPAAPCLVDALGGGAAFRDIVTRDRDSRLQVVAAGSAGTEVGALVGSPRFAAAAAGLARAYDYLVIDACALPAESHRHIAPLARWAVLVAPGESEQSIQAARERLVAAGFLAVSVVTNVPPQEARVRPMAA